MTLLAKWLKRAANLFSEKPDVKVDDFGMEHFLVYHGLIGSSPENQRDFKDVRADIASAVGRKNSHSLCIHLKLPPLLWEDKLKRIFTELYENSPENTLASLMPPKSDDYEVQDYDPLRHQDWRVRSNAALILAHLKVLNSQENIARALAATADSTTPAYCHISRAMGSFQTEQAKAALAEQLDNVEPWIKVDSVTALAQWPLSATAHLLGAAFKHHHDFTDYASVGLSRNHAPLEFLKPNAAASASEQEMVELGAAIIVGLLDASKATFSASPEILTEANIYECLTPLAEAFQKQPTALRMRALHQLTEWIDNNYSLVFEATADAAVLESAKKICLDKDARARVVAEIEAAALALPKPRNDSAELPAELPLSSLRHGFKLAGEAQLTELLGLMTSLLNAPQAVAYRDVIIEALGRLGDSASAAPLIKLAQQLVNVESRGMLAPSASPVVESDPEASKSYWYILQALGNLHNEDALDFLVKASKDHASDKREAALAAIVKLLAENRALDKNNSGSEIVAHSLNDPSTQVRLAALQGVAAMNLQTSIATVSRMINAQEISVARASFDTLETLAENGGKAAVKEALIEVKKTTSATNKLKKIDDFIAANC